MFVVVSISVSGLGLPAMLGQRSVPLQPHFFGGGVIKTINDKIIIIISQ